MSSPPPLPPCSELSQLASEQHAASLGLARLSSCQSLAAPLDDSDTRRSLLVIYIHGFYGNNLSFQSFPAHIHALLTHLLSDTHVVRSKIYPRYKTYHAIQVARDNFSAWLEPHQSPTTDVILVGHSMGGLLAAEVVLMPSHDSHASQQFKHSILGTISLDSPFLGLHPGIVISGLSSLFQPAPKPDQDASRTSSQPSLDQGPGIGPGATPSASTASTASTASSPSQTHTSDALYDPPYFNDVPFRERPFVSRLANFALKHKAEGFFNAMSNHIISHLEFGGCMADYPELAARYKKIRALEDVDELNVSESGHAPEAHRRVRFVNYYTLSTGRSKPVEAAQATQLDAINVCQSMSTLDLTDAVSASTVDDSEHAETKSSTEEPHSSDEVTAEKVTVSQDICKLPMESLQPLPMTEEDVAALRDANSKSFSGSVTVDELDLPSLPPEPEEPVPLNFSSDMDKDARRQVDKEAKRQLKAYQQAIKDRVKAVRERERIMEKRRKRAEKETRHAEKQSAKEQLEAQKKMEKEAKKAAAAPMTGETSSSPGGQGAAGQGNATAQKPKKLGKFCALPGGPNGQNDSAWVGVLMKDTDEVGAHCGLFVAGAPHYDGLVGDVGSRIVQWVHDDMSLRAALCR